MGNARPDSTGTGPPGVEIGRFCQQVVRGAWQNLLPGFTLFRLMARTGETPAVQEYPDA